MKHFYHILDELVPALLADYGVPGAGIAVVQAGEIAYARGFGFKRGCIGEP